MSVIKGQMTDKRSKQSQCEEKRSTVSDRECPPAGRDLDLSTTNNGPQCKHKHQSLFLKKPTQASGCGLRG
jgi:hypothetical protein